MVKVNAENSWLRAEAAQSDGAVPTPVEDEPTGPVDAGQVHDAHGEYTGRILRAFWRLGVR
jgi:hypothetical protein